jgi:hypothetical protein
MFSSLLGLAERLAPFFFTPHKIYGRHYSYEVLVSKKLIMQYIIKGGKAIGSKRQNGFCEKVQTYDTQNVTGLISPL